MKAYCKPLAVLAAILAFALWNGAAMTRHTGRWRDQVQQADALAQAGEWSQAVEVLADSYGMQIMLTRSFNHIGPYQDGRFVVPSFVQRILKLKKAGSASGEIETGDVSIVRDFVDVRDVVRAYDMLLERGTPGEVYNIASGRGVRLSEIIEEIGRQVDVRVTSCVNPEFVRPDDNRVVIGSPEKIERELGWKAKIPLEKTIEDMITCMELQ